MRLLENVSGGGWTKWLVMLGRGAALGRVHPLQVSTLHNTLSPDTAITTASTPPKLEEKYTS